MFYLLIVLCPLVKAQTVTVSGLQSGTWDADTVLVVGNVEVDGSLEVMPGTVVLFDGFYSIAVGSGDEFVAQGAETDSVIFTVADTTGFYIYNIGVGGWNGFQIDEAERFFMNYCVLEYGKAADTLDRFGGALCINRCDDVEIRNSTLRCNFSREQGGAIYAIDSDVTVSDCRINENQVYTGDNVFAMYGGGAQFFKCDVIMTGIEFHANYAPSCIGGALSIDSSAVFLDRAVFTDNYGLNGGGMYIMRCNHKECHMSNLLFDSNISGHFAGGLAFKDASPDVNNILVTNNESIGVSCSGVFFYNNCSPKMNNCIVYSNYWKDTSIIPDTIQMLDTVQMWVWHYDDGYAPEFRNCLVEGGLKKIRGNEYITVFEDVIDTDPLFVDFEGHDFRLRPNSPCVDAGLATTPSYVLEGMDLEGNARVINGRIDMGPYECLTASVRHQDAALSFAQLIGNPLGVHSRIEFDRPMEGEVILSVYAVTGRCAASKAFNLEGSRTLGIGGLVEGLAPGIYLIKVSVKEEACVLKAIR